MNTGWANHGGRRFLANGADIGDSGGGAAAAALALARGPSHGGEGWAAQATGTLVMMMIYPVTSV